MPKNVVLGAGCKRNVLPVNFELLLTQILGELDLLEESIDAVGSTIEGVVMDLLKVMEADDADTCTVLAGENYTDEQLAALVALIEETYEDLEVDSHRGEQPLYPVIFSVE